MVVLVLMCKNLISDPDGDNLVHHPALSALIIMMQHQESKLSGASHHFEGMSNALLHQRLYSPDSNSV